MKFRGFNTTTKIGIGTTAPARTLDVQGPAGNDDVIAIRHASGGSSWLKLGFWNGTTERASIRTQDDASHVSIFCSTTERLRIMSDGNVGIGTTAPSRLFDVNGTSYFRDDIYFGNTVLNPASGFNTQIGMGWDKSTGQFQIAASSTTALQVGRITTAGVIQQWRYAGTVVASLESSGQVRSLGGALSAPSFSFTNDTTTGMSRPTTGAINFVTAGTERVRIAADGKVGIGGTPTVAQLDILSSVSGNYLYMDDGANCLWKISSTTTSGIIQTQATGWSSWKPMDLRANYFQFKPNNSEIMRILSTGVGIGTTVPSGLLDLYEPASGDNKLRFHSSATGTGTSNGSRIGLNGTELFINNLESSTIKIYTQSTATNGITIASDGKVGIGSTTPLDKLHVQGNILQLDGSPEYHFGTISASHLNWRVACQEVVSQGFEIASGTASAGTSAPSDTYTNRFVIKGATGQIQFNSYGGGTHTGTSAYKLSVDSSGNIIETSIGSGAVDGAGTTNYISKWTDSDTIGNSSIVDNATSVYISKNTIIGRNQSMNPRLVLSSAAKSANLGKADTGMALCIDSGTSDSNQSVGHLTQIGLGLINAYQPAAIGAMVSNAAAYTSTHLVFATRPTTTDVAPTERMRIQDDGKVGIGTTAPSSRLTINGGIGSHATGLTFGDGDTGFYENSDDSMWYFSGGVDRWKSDSGYLLSTITTFKATIVNEVATATNPVYTFYTDLDTGLGHAAANQLSLIAGGVKAAVVTSTGFGIRTTPATGVILDVRDSGDANTKQYLINTGQTTAGRETEYIFGKDNGANLSAVLKYYYHTTQASRRIDLLHYITNAGLSILNTGSIGINDTAPDHMLTLKGGTVNGSTRYPGINGKQGSSTLWAMSQWYGNEGYIGLYLNNTRTIQFRAGETAGGAAHSYINTGSGNNFGVGTATPGAKLEIQGDTSARALLAAGSSTSAAVGYFYTNAIHTGVDTSSIVSIRSDHASSTGKVLHVRGDGSGNLLTLNQGGTDRLVVQADGNVGIGTTAPSALFHVYESSAGEKNWYMENAGSGVGQLNIKGGSGRYMSLARSGTMGTILVDGAFKIMNHSGGWNTSIYCTAAGDVGIGHSNVYYKLDVSGTFRATGQAYLNGGLRLGGANSNFAGERLFNMPSFANGVANQKIDLYWTGAFWGYFEIEITSGYSHQNATGVLTKSFAFGANVSNAIYLNESWYSNVGGLTHGNFAISGITWDSTNSRYRIQIVHRVSTANGMTLKMRCLGASAAHADTFMSGTTVGSVYTTDTTAFALAVVQLAAPNDNAWVDGYLGIGTATPAARLHAHNTSSGSTWLKIGNATRADGMLIGCDSNELQQIYVNGANPLTFWTNDTERIRIAGDGNVGIGTSSPAATLHVRDTTASTGRWTAAFVADNAATVSAQTHDHVLIQSNDVPSLKLYEYGQNQVGGIAVGDNNTTIASTETLRFFVNGSATGNIYDGMGGTLAIYIKTDGNVGIGTSAPSTGKFNVGYTNDVAPIVYAQGSEGLVINATRHDASNYRSYIDFLAGRGSDATNGGASMRFFTQPRSSAAPIQALTLQYDGKVGIGVTAPTGLLSLPADEETFPQIRFQSEYGTTLADCALSTEGDSGGTNLLIGSNQYYSGGTITRFTTDRSGSAINFGYTGRMSFYTGSGNSAPSVKMSIISDGNVGIGNTSPAYRLEVTGSATADWISKIHNTGTTSTPSGLIVKTDYNVATATGGYLLGLLAGTDYRLVVQNDGNVGIGTITPAYALDVVGYAKVSLGIKVGGGSAGNSTNPAITVGSVNTAGVYFESSGVGFGSGSSTKKLFLRSDGDVGIGYSGSIAPPYGTTSPTILIIKPRQQSSDAALRLARFADDVVGLDIWADGGSGTHDSYFDNRYELSDWIFRSGTRGAGTIDEVMRVTGEGNVGIGTTDVRGTLQIGSGNGGGNVPAGRELVFGANNSEIMFLSANDASSVDGTIGAWNTVYNVQNSKIEFHKNTWNMGQLKFYTNNGAGITERMVIANTGHVGIGTTTPVTQNGDVGLLVSLYSATSSKNLALSLAYTGGTDAQWAILEGRNNSSPAGDKRVAQIALGNPDGAQQDRGAITFGVFHDGAYEEAARIISDGNVGINTNAPSQALHVKGNVNVTDAGNASYGTILFGDNASRFIRGNSAEVQIGPTINQLHFLKTNGAGQIATSAANGTTAIQILARIAHTSGNILEVLNASTSVMTVDYSGILTTPYMIATNSIASGGCNPRTDNAHDLGNQSYRWRQLHLGNFYVTGSVFAANTADGYDNKETYICAGGSQSSTRGSYIDMTGNDYPTWGGLINLVAGEGANAKVAITTGGAERMSISTGGLTKFSGSVGIGTVPGDLLHIYGTRPTIRLQGGSGLWMMRSDDNQSHRFEIIDANGGYDKFAIYPGNTGAIVLHSDGAGCVGIGTTSPSERLQVVGNAYIQAPAAGAEVSVSIMQQGGNVNYHDCRIKFQQSDGWQIEAMNHNANGNNAYDFGINYNRNAYAGDFYIANNGTKNFFLKANGKVGIGTNPTARLYVVETANNAWALQVKGTGTSANYGLEVNCSAGYALSSQPFKVETPSGGPFFIDGNSNVIIGGTTSNLTYNNGLQITNASNVANLKLKSGSSTGLDLWQDTGGSGYIIVHDNAPLYLRTNNVTRLTISAGGGITLANNQILSVGTGASNSSGKVRLYGANANDFYMDWMPLASERQFRFAGKASTSDYKTYFTQAGTGKHNLWVSGTLEAVGACTLASGGATSTFGGCVGIGVNPGYMLQVNGSFAATSKSFVIDHPIKPDYMLEYGALEGPEFGVYHRGRVESDTITLPDYWSGLVRDGTITVQLTPNGSFQHLYVVSTSLTEIKIGAAEGETIDCYYTIYGERADLDPLVVEKIV